jgi:hypothetical protein
VRGVNSNHWYTLGLMLGHVVLNRYSFFIDQPVCFFKMMSSGISSLNPLDLASINRKQAVELLKMFHLSDDELDSFMLDLGDNENPFAYGNVTKGNLEYYILESSRFVVKVC